MKKIALTLFVLIASVIILIYTKAILIPILLSIILWIVIKHSYSLLDRVPFLKMKVPNWMKSIVLFGLTVLLFFLVKGILFSNYEMIVKSIPKYQDNLNGITQNINATLGININELLNFESSEFDIRGVLESVFATFSSLLGNFALILIYLLFIFLETTNFSKKIRILFKDEREYKKKMDLLVEIENSVSNYLGVKTLISLTTGVLSGIALKLIGVDAPVFWALIIFTLNYIPTIGSLIGTLFPAFFCLLQFGEVSPCIITLLVVGAIQVIIGNIVEPKIVGKSMNISSFVAIVSLSLWGLFWGVIGMIISVPITVIMIIIFSKFDSTKAIAVLLSNDGEIS